ncbi:MAG: hypothetical protein WAV15_03385 [Minisyncoccia bacterium]
MDKKLLIVPAAVVIVGLAIFTGSREPNKTLTTENETLFSERNSVESQWETKTDDQDLVSVTVTPKDISPRSKEWKFNVIMSTHSVELDQEMLEVATLTDALGKKNKALRWEGAPAGGHHREGALIFKPITPYPQSLTLVMENIGDVERRLSWDTAEGSNGNN